MDTIKITFRKPKEFGMTQSVDSDFASAGTTEVYQVTWDKKVQQKEVMNEIPNKVSTPSILLDDNEGCIFNVEDVAYRKQSSPHERTLPQQAI